MADCIAGALVDIAYSKEDDPKIAVEVLIEHGVCHIIREFLFEYKEHEKTNKIDFNPFYDSYFLISKEGETERRYLVELYEDELKQLKFEIDCILEHSGWNT